MADGTARTHDLCRHGDAPAACRWCTLEHYLGDAAERFVCLGDVDDDLGAWREYCALGDDPAVERPSRREREADEQDLRDLWATERQRIAAVRGGR